MDTPLNTSDIMENSVFAKMIAGENVGNESWNDNLPFGSNSYAPSLSKFALPMPSSDGFRGLLSNSMNYLIPSHAENTPSTSVPTSFSGILGGIQRDAGSRDYKSQIESRHSDEIRQADNDVIMHFKKETEKPATPDRNPDSAQAKWSSEELEMFVDGLRQYDRNFNAICSHIGSRSADQVKGRYRRTLKKLKGRNVVLNGSDEELEAVCNYELKEARKRAGPMKLGSVRLKCDPIAASEGRYKVQIIPCDDIDSQLLVEHGFNPKILIILRGSRSIRGVVNHLNTRWQSALESSGKSVELVTSTLDNKVVEVSGTVEALFIAIGCPSTFRLMYKLEPLEKSSNAIQMKSNHYAQCSDTLKQTSDQNHIPFEHHSTSAPSATKAVLPSDAAVSLPGDSVFGLFGQNTMNQAHGTGATVDTISEPVAASQYIPLTWNENAVDTEFSNDHNTPSISPPSLCPEENSLLVGTGFSTLFGQMPASNQQ